MSVTLRQLEVFVAVAETAHFGNAAERLHISQPVVSQEIRRLERALDAPLFERTTRTVRLTRAGRTLLDDARDVCCAVDTFVTRGRRLSAGRANRLRIAVTPSVVDQILPAILRRAEDDLPGALLEEVPVETGEVADALEHRDCDVGLGRYIEPTPGQRSETIRSERMLVALSSRHPLAEEPEIDLARLEDLPLLLWPREQNPPYHDRIVRICAERGLEPLLLVSPPRIVGGRSYLIADNRAFCLIPESTACRLSGDIRAVPPARPASVPLSVVWTDHDPRPLVTEFVRLAREVGAESSAG